jgi:MFS family permease
MGGASEFNRASILATVAAWMGFFIGPNALLAASQGLFMQPQAESFHLSRTAISLVMLIAPWTVAACAPWGGMLLDRWGLRRTLLPGVALFGVAHLLGSRVTSTWQLVLVTVMISIAASVHSAVGYAKVVTLWFSHNRGFVLGLVTALGTGLSSALVPQFLHIIVRDSGWRSGYIAIGALILLVGLPVIAALLHEPPGAVGANAADPAQPAMPGASPSQALRNRDFWLIFLAITLTSTALLGTIMHAFPMLTERGFSGELATTAISVIFALATCSGTCWEPRASDLAWDW